MFYESTNPSAGVFNKKEGGKGKTKEGKHPAPATMIPALQQETGMASTLKKAKKKKKEREIQSLLTWRNSGFRTISSIITAEFLVSHHKNLTLSFLWGCFLPHTMVYTSLEAKRKDRFVYMFSPLKNRSPVLRTNFLELALNFRQNGSAVLNRLKIRYRCSEWSDTWYRVKTWPGRKAMPGTQEYIAVPR